MSFETEEFGGGAVSFADRAPPKTTQVYGRINLNTLAKPRVRSGPPMPTEVSKRPVYLCPELGRTCNRPGAYDAYDLPSMYAGKLKPYRFAE